ncbi:MAG: phytanoyl-CoA dioxygenase family protein [Fimbriimonadaceae bacterium]|nr:phytanoyl-CoA dioxygenase family protein [Fimbriimonadaceae bacterium]
MAQSEYDGCVAAADFYSENGYWVAPGLFGGDEVALLGNHFMEMNAQQSGYREADGHNDDPLQRFPRKMMPHRWDERSLGWLLDPRLDRVFRDILGASPIAVQTMFYYKPPGARGQALHQDNFYLLAQPGSCCAAWMAVDPCDEANGCLQVVPGSHVLPNLCTVEADQGESFTDVTVPIPPGMEAVPVVMSPGDVLFFHGQLIHGSLPNRTHDRFRRCLIGHYVTAEATEVSRFYHPCLRMDGTVAELEEAVGGGECGRFEGEELHLERLQSPSPAHE